MSEFKQVLLINRDLKMDKGKMVVQGMHGEVDYMSETSIGRMNDNRREWMKDGIMKKIVLKATEAEFHSIVDAYGSTYWMHPVYDMGLTQVPENSLTGMIVEPLPERTCAELFGDLKLL